MCMLCYLFAHSPVATASNSILVVQDSHNDVAEEIIQAFSEHLISKSITVDVLDLSSQTFPDNSHLQTYSALITIGTQAAETTINNNPPVRSLSLLISKQSWLLLSQQQSSHQRSAILLDQPVSRQFHLIREIFGIDNNIGILLGPYSSALEPDITESAKLLQQGTTVRTIKNTDELISALTSLTGNVDILLAEPDPIVYNKRSIQGVLLLSYRNKTPVVGFSQAYSRAGAMVSLYSSTSDIAKQAIEIILAPSTPERPFYHPKYFSISFNQQVSRTLGITPPDEQKLIERIRQIEK